jgi:hypothetical protein
MEHIAASDELVEETRRRAREHLVAWHDVAAWLDYAAAEFVADATTRGYLEHVGQCVRDEGERRHAARAGFAVA